MPANHKVIWTGVIDKCELCEREIWQSFFDAKIRGGGPWAIMCPDCFITRGLGLGTGLGQSYRLEYIGPDRKAWVKVGG